jgi:acetylglutamate kinase
MDQQLYNVNADQMASAIAGETRSDTLVYLTDVDGVLDPAGNVIARLSSAEIGDLWRRGILTGGMLPKTSSALGAIEKGVRRVCILPGRVPGVLSRLVDGQPAGGTSIHD